MFLDDENKGVLTVFESAIVQTADAGDSLYELQSRLICRDFPDCSSLQCAFASPLQGKPNVWRFTAAPISIYAAQRREHKSLAFPATQGLTETQQFSRAAARE